MSATTTILTLSDLSPELFPLIVEHLPFVYRPSTLLSLALTCHRLHDIVFPQLLYNTVWLAGEDQALKTLDSLIAKAELVTEEDIRQRGNPSLSHCIHHLCLYSSIKPPIRTRSSLDSLQQLMEVNGLRHLESLTIRAPERNRTAEDDQTGQFKLPTSFVSSLEMRCPNLKRIQLSHCPEAEEFERAWIESNIFSLKGLTSIRLEGYFIDSINLSALPQSLHTLELRLDNLQETIDSSVILSCVLPNLRTLILDDIFLTEPLATNAFWRAHPGIERLELHSGVVGNWFTDFEVGMLTNLKYLLCNVDHAFALLLSRSKSLITLSICWTYNAQGPYLLRVVSQGGVLPELRSLSIHSVSGHGSRGQKGHRWREDSNGIVSLADAVRPARKIDGNYIMSLSKAAPNLEELELMGTFDDTLDSLTASLSMFPRLHRITFSGGLNSTYKPFFASSLNWEESADFLRGRVAEGNYGNYAPAMVDQAVRDLANGCRTLEVVTMGGHFCELSIKEGLSWKVVREGERGVVKHLKKTKALGNIIGREYEW